MVMACSPIKKQTNKQKLPEIQQIKMVLVKCEKKKKNCEVTHYRPHTRSAIDKEQKMKISKCPHVHVSQGVFSNIIEPGRRFSTLSCLFCLLLQIFDISAILK